MKTVRNRITKASVVAALAASMLLSFTSTALAHDPIFITADQTTPDTGPFMPDGSISWALYGSVLDDGDTRGFEFDLREGDEVFVSLLIPNIEPEVDLADEQLPVIELEAPDGTLTMIVPEVRDVFDEPFSNTSYVTLAEHREPAQAGRYRGVIVGSAPARFSVAIGETEIFFTETERSGDRPSNFAEITVPLTAWYTTPPGGEQDLSALQEGEAEIDLDMIEDAMESGEADAPEGSLESEESAIEEDATEPAPEPEPELEPEPEPEPELEQEVGDEAAEVVETDDNNGESTETASAAVVDDEGSSTTWVAPAIIAAIAVIGGGAFFARRDRI